MTKPSTISQCMLNAAAMMETDANQYTAPQELSKEQRKSIAACNQGQAELLRRSADMADELVHALASAERTYAALERNIDLLHEALRVKGLPSSWLGTELAKAVKVRAALAKVEQ